MIFLSPLLHIVKMFILTGSVLTQLGSGILCPQIVFLNSFPIAFPSFSSFSCNFMPSMEWNPVKNLHINSLYQKICFQASSWQLCLTQSFLKSFQTGEPEQVLLLFIYLFFSYLGFLSRTFMIHRTAGEGESYLFNYSLSLPPTSQTLRH